MLLEIDHRVFSDHLSDSMPVIRMVGYTVEERHSWLPSPDVALLAVSFLEDHVPKMVSWREYVTNAAKASAWQSANAPRPVHVTTDNVTTLVEELGRPAVIVVENARNDGSFLRAVFAAYDPRIH